MTPTSPVVIKTKRGKKNWKNDAATTVPNDFNQEHQPEQQSNEVAKLEQLQHQVKLLLQGMQEEKSRLVQYHKKLQASLVVHTERAKARHGSQNTTGTMLLLRRVQGTQLKLTVVRQAVRFLQQQIQRIHRMIKKRPKEQQGKIKSGGGSDKDDDKNNNKCFSISPPSPLLLQTLLASRDISNYKARLEEVLARQFSESSSNSFVSPLESPMASISSFSLPCSSSSLSSTTSVLAPLLLVTKHEQDSNAVTSQELMRNLLGNTVNHQEPSHHVTGHNNDRALAPAAAFSNKQKELVLLWQDHSFIMDDME
ncbi:hypothetical protein ACA910_015398 [Epithemia clementina (nom. ined.)]